MAFDQTLALRIRSTLLGQADVEEKKMFGGLCFMVAGHMCCGIVGEKLMARVGPEQYRACLAEAHAGPMDFTGRPMTGMIYVKPEGIDDDAQLADWLGKCLHFVYSLPPKSAGKSPRKNKAAANPPRS